MRAARLATLGFVPTKDQPDRPPNSAHPIGPAAPFARAQRGGYAPQHKLPSRCGATPLAEVRVPAHGRKFTQRSRHEQRPRRHRHRAWLIRRRRPIGWRGFAGPALAVQRHLPPRTWLALLAAVLATLALGVITGSLDGGGQDATAIVKVPPDNPRLGLVYQGLSPAGDGTPCVGAYQVIAPDLCTHGPDEPPAGLDVHRDIAPVAAGEAAPALPRQNIAAVPDDSVVWLDAGVTTEGGGASRAPGAPALVPDAPADAARPDGTVCAGDGESGKRVQVLYAYETGTASRYSQYLASFRAWAAGVDTIVDASAAETGGVRHVRYVTTPGCEIAVAEVEVPAGALDTFNATIAVLRTLGYDRADRKYTIFADTHVYCGIGTFAADGRPGAANRSNGGTGYGRVDAGCWSPVVAAHELGHNLGAVHRGSPHANQTGHCVDGIDVMCYGSTPAADRCPRRAAVPRLDCGHDDYFNTDPRPGSYLAKHWNVADSQFLTHGDSAAGDPAGGRAEPRPPAPTAATPPAQAATPNAPGPIEPPVPADVPGAYATPSPATPADPAGTADPAAPANTATPGGGAAPATPGHPATPGRSAPPNRPATPGNQAAPAGPADPAAPGAADPAGSAAPGGSATLAPAGANPPAGGAEKPGAGPAATPSAAAPGSGQPAALQVNATTSTAVRVTWPPAGHGAQYGVLMDGRVVGWTAATAARVIGLRPDTAYRLQVVTGDPKNARPYTGAASARTPATRRPADGAPFILGNALTGEVATLQAARAAGGAPLVMQPGTGAANQVWQLQPAGDGSYLLRSQATGKCVVARGGRAVAGAPLVQQSCPSLPAAGQRWLVTATGYGFALTAVDAAGGPLVIGVGVPRFCDDRLLVLQRPARIRHQSWTVL